MINLYNILGVSKNASQQEIKQAYRQLAMKYHPDSSNTKDTTELFVKINKAYQILVVPERRAWYDQQLYKSKSRASDRRSYKHNPVSEKTRAEAAARYRYYKTVMQREKSLPVWRRQGFFIATLSLMIIFLSVLFFNDLHYLMIRRHNTYTTGVVLSPYSFKSSKNLHYSYKVAGESFVEHESRPTKPGLGKIIPKNGIPVIKGYKYIVWYNPEHPERSIIDLEYPTGATILEIQKKAAMILQDHYGFTRGQSYCMINELYRIKGLTALGHILCSRIKWYQNIDHNLTTFKKLKKSNLWDEASKKCSNGL
ncbi:MAG: J domain-containing protein [Bacteroidales bacterium]|nr:J domain-containing protein [Bacteroidales bacterium]